MKQRAAALVLTLVLGGCAYAPGTPVTDARTAIEIGRTACKAKAQATGNKLYPDGLDDLSYWKAKRIAGIWQVDYPWMTFMEVSVDASNGKAGDCSIEIGAY